MQSGDKVLFTKEMKETHTILVPQMAPFHFDFIVESLRMEGYKACLLTNDDRDVVDQGIKYVHNDACYPAVLSIGQMISALKSGRYDVDQVALIMTQTGGGCRASNYISLLREALKKAELGHIPVISLNINKLEKHPGFELSLTFWLTAFHSLILGDLLQHLYNQTRPYQLESGTCEEVRSLFVSETCQLILQKKLALFSTVKKMALRAIDLFEQIGIKSLKLPLVGIVGEIYIKYSPLGNNHLEDYLLEHESEPVVPPILDFFLFKMDYRALEVELYGGKRLKQHLINYAIQVIDGRRKWINARLARTRFRSLGDFESLKKCAEGLANRGNRMGEGWLLTAEMVHLIKEGVPNIVCAQPFGCLPNHITGKGTMKPIRSHYPEANIVAIDYDPGASRANQENRIKLMLNYALEKVNLVNGIIDKEPVKSIESDINIV